jgi:exonuclease III
MQDDYLGHVHSRQLKQTRFYEELEHVFKKLPTRYTKILLGDFNTKVGREDIFKSTTGNKSCMKLVMIMELE